MAKIEQEKSVTQKTVVGYICDQCGNEVFLYDDESDKWVTFSHGHCAWGNDSGDSVAHFNLCSPACYLKQLKESADEMGDNQGAQVDRKSVDFVRALLAHIESEADEAAHRMRLNYEP